MKKTILILLLTALCVTVFTSCDLGNGLVAELFGDLKDVTIGEQHYHTDDYIQIETDIVIDIEPMPPVEIETTPPYEIGTEHWTEVWTTQPETGCDCGSCDLTEPMPDADLLIYEINAVECHYADGMNHWTPIGETPFYELDLRYDTVQVAFSGSTSLYDGAVVLGYRIGDAYVFDDSFWTYSDNEAAVDEDLRAFRITIPADQFEDGYNDMTFVYDFYGQIVELGTLLVFKEVPTTQGEDTVDAVVEETVEEPTTEIEFPEIDIEE